MCHNVAVIIIDGNSRLLFYDKPFNEIIWQHQEFLNLIVIITKYYEGAHKK
jgi:hypothetical protein